MDWDLSSQGPPHISRDDNSFLYAGSATALPQGGPEVGVDGVATGVGAVEPDVEVGLVVPGLVLNAVGRELEWIITEYNDDRSGVRANNPLIVFAVLLIVCGPPSGHQDSSCCTSCPTRLIDLLALTTKAWDPWASSGSSVIVILYQL